jgi:hypothetical protein
MSKFITKQEHPEEHKQIIGFVQRFKEEADHKVHSQFLPKEAIEKLITQENFGGIKIHYGRNDEGTRHMIMEATDTNNKSLGCFVSQLPTCPPWCTDIDDDSDNTNG